MIELPGWGTLPAGGGIQAKHEGTSHVKEKGDREYSRQRELQGWRFCGEGSCSLSQEAKERQGGGRRGLTRMGSALLSTKSSLSLGVGEGVQAGRSRAPATPGQLQTTSPEGLPSALHPCSSSLDPTTLAALRLPGETDNGK